MHLHFPIFNQPSIPRLYISITMPNAPTFVRINIR